MSACVYCHKPCRYTAERGPACEACYLRGMYGFDRNRRDAEALANMAGMNFVVVELDPACRAAVRCAKIGQKAYTVWSRSAAEGFGSRIVEEYAPNVGRVFQNAELAP